MKRLQKEIPGIRIAVIAHGDYCDASYAYVTKIMDFSTDEKKLCDFVETVGSTGAYPTVSIAIAQLLRTCRHVCNCIVVSLSYCVCMYD